MRWQVPGLPPPVHGVLGHIQVGHLLDRTHGSVVVEGALADWKRKEWIKPDEFSAYIWFQEWSAAV